MLYKGVKSSKKFITSRGSHVGTLRSGQDDTTRQLGSKKGPEPPEPPRFGSDLTDLVADLLTWRFRSQGGA